VLFRSSGVTGQVFTNTEVVFTNNGASYGGFEGLITTNGLLWSSGGANTCLNCGSGGSGNWSLVIYNPNSRTTNIITNPHGSLCMAADPQSGNVWITALGSNTVAVYDASGNFLTTYNHQDTTGDGMAIGANGHVWIAHGPSGGMTVSHLLNDGTFVGNVSLSTTNCAANYRASIPCISSDGKVWAVGIGSPNPTIFRIDPNGGSTITNHGTNVSIGSADVCITLTNHNGRQSQGDLTGQKLGLLNPAYGIWDVIYTSGAAGEPWSTVTWTATTTDTKPNTG